MMLLEANTTSYKVENMSKFIFPLQTSTTDGKYHNYFGEFSQDSLMKDGSYEFGISESHSGLFHLEDLSQKKIPAAKHLQIICRQCDPRLANIEGGM